MLLRLRDQRLAGRVDLAAHRAGADRLEGGALDRLDLAQQVLELGVRLAQDRHAGEVADIAVIVAAGIDREHVALLPALLRRRAVVARARRDQAILEGEPAIDLLAPQRLGDLRLGRARAMVGDHRHHGVDHLLGCRAQHRELLRRLAQRAAAPARPAHPSISLSGNALRNAAPASIGMKVVSMPMRLAGTPARRR